MTKIVRNCFFIFTLLLFSFSSWGEIFECNNILEALHHIQKDSCLVYEIDSVLMKGDSTVSRVHFLNCLKEEMLEKGWDLNQIIHHLYPEWAKVIRRAEMVPMSQEVFKFIEGLKAKGCLAFGLTHRGPNLAYVTSDQLKKLGLDYNRDYFEKEYLNLGEAENAVFYLGNVFVHPKCSKGEYLLTFFETLNQTIKKVVFIDHELVHLVEIEKKLAENGIEFSGIYLRNKENFLTEWDIQIGKLQLENIDKILPDKYARHLVNREK